MLRFVLTATFFLFSIVVAAADCKSDFDRIVKKLDNSGPYHSDITSFHWDWETRTTTVLSRIELDFVSPTTYRTKETVGKKTIEHIKIGAQVWVKDGPRWKQLTANDGNEFDWKDKSPWMIFHKWPLSERSPIECSGPIKVNGAEYLVYDIPAPPHTWDLPTNNLFVDPATGLPVRFSLIGVPGGVNQTYRYDSSIKMVAPTVR